MREGSCVAGGRQQPRGKAALRLPHLRGQTAEPMYGDFERSSDKISIPTAGSRGKNTLGGPK